MGRPAYLLTRSITQGLADLLQILRRLLQIGLDQPLEEFPIVVETTDLLQHLPVQTGQLLLGRIDGGIIHHRFSIVLRGGCCQRQRLPGQVYSRGGGGFDAVIRPKRVALSRNGSRPGTPGFFLLQRHQRSRSFECQPAGQYRCQLFLGKGFGQIVVHPGIQAPLPVPFHGIGGQGDDGQWSPLARPLPTA